MKRIAIAIIVAISSLYTVLSWAQTGTPSTKAGVITSINANFPDNTTGAITPFLLRQGLFNIVSSMQQYGCVHALTATTYTMLSTDYGCLLTFSNSNPMTLSLPAGPTINPFNAFISNYGGGNLTITPAAGTIAGLSSFTVGSGAGIWIVNDGTNWQLFRGSGSGAGGLLIGEAINGSSSGGILYNTAANLLADDGPFIVPTFPPTLSNGQWSIGSTTSGGAILIGQGSTNDIQIQNSVGTNVILIPTSSTIVNMPGLQTGGSIASAICATATGTLIANASTNCFGGAGGTPGGLNSQVQFNTNSSFGGISGMTTDAASVTINTATIGNLTASKGFFTGNLTGTTAQFSGAVTGTTAQFQTYTGSTLTLTGNLTGTTAQLSGALTGTTSQMQTRTGATLNLTSNLTGTTAQFSGAVTGTTAQFQTYTGSTANLTGNLTGTTAQFSGAVTGTTAQFQTHTGATLNLTSNLTGTTAQFSGLLTGTNAQFQTITVGNLTPTGPNCLQETGGVLQATNAACSSGGGTPAGSATQVQINTTGSAFGADAGLVYAGQGVGNGLTIAQGTIATNVKALNITATWNSTGLAFDAPFFMNIVTGGLAGSIMMDLQAISSSRFSFYPIGLSAGSSNQLAGPILVFANVAGSGIGNTSGSGLAQVANGGARWGYTDSNQWRVNFNSNVGLQIFNTSLFGWTNSNDAATGTVDVSLFREASGYLSLRNGTTAQTLAVFNTYSSAAINEGGIFDWQGTLVTPATTNVLNVGTVTTGTGAGRFMSFVVSNTRAALVSTTSTSFSAALNAPAIAQLAANTTGYVCWTTGTGALSEDSATCLASLRALKMNINPFSGATTELMALKPSTFEWRQPADRNQQGPQLGFIADDVVAIDPRLATHTSDGSLRGWQEPGMIALLVAGFQEQQREITSLKAQLARLRQ